MIPKGHDPFDTLAEQIDRITAELSAPGSTSATEEGRAELHHALVAMARELRDRREAETELRHSEGHFRVLVERLPDVVTVIDADGNIRYASPSLATVFGYAPQDAMGLALADLVHPEAAPVLREHLARVAGRPGTAESCDVRVRHRDGSWRVAELVGQRLGERGELVLAWRDVSERRRAERRLKESEERYALAEEGTGDGLWDWDLPTDRIVFSTRWKAMLGCDPAAVGEHAGEWLTRVHPDDVAQLKADIAAHLEGRSQRLVAEYRLKLADGSYRWMLARGLAVHGADGRASRMAGTQSDISARKAAEELLVHQALHDALTGLPNRVAFVERLERSIRRAVRGPGYRFAVLFLDIDRFKLVNDSLGHLSGDQLLIAFAKRLLSCLRPGDMVAHMGSDEFAILADHIHQPADATQIAQRIQRELSEPFKLDEQEVFAAASIGIALSTAVYQRPEELLRDADSAMYRAKAGGTGRYELFDRAMQQRALVRLQLETDLRRAVERRELRVHYQPIISLDSGAVSGFEALVRWQHPERGLIGAADFVPVAEETGLIVPICTWVVREACAQARRWQQSYPAQRLKISMNMTSTHFTDTEVMRGVEEALQESGLQGRDLILEITESVLMKDIDSVIAVLLALKSLEIGLHIDDFGTGYSSLSYLHSLPTDALKIDRSFVARIGAEPDSGDDVIVRTIIEMAHTLGRQVIAEGIETPQQLQRLRHLGCEFGQGFFFSRPVDHETAEALLRTEPRW